MQKQNNALGTIIKIVLFVVLGIFIAVRFGPGIAKTAKAVKNNETINLWEAFEMGEWFEGGWDIFKIFDDKENESATETESQSQEDSEDVSETEEEIKKQTMPVIRNGAE